MLVRWMMKRLPSEAPEELPEDDMVVLRAWCDDKFPWHSRELLTLVGACLDYHGARGPRCVSWRRACQSWVRKHDEWNPENRMLWHKKAREAHETEKFQTELREARANPAKHRPLKLLRGKGPLVDELNDALRKTRDSS